METLATLLPLLLIGGVFWLLILRPAKARQKAQQDLVSSVQPGQRIMTTAGLFGTVTEVTDEEISLEIAPGVVVRYVKAAVGRVLPDDDATGDETLADDTVADATTTDATTTDATTTDATAADGAPAASPESTSDETLDLTESDHAGRSAAAGEDVPVEVAGDATPGRATA